MNKAAIPIILIEVVLLIFFLVMKINFFAIILLLVICFTMFFFRDPVREITANNKQIVSPADGRIMQISEIKEGEKLYKKINIFLSIFDVHINRSPVHGKINEIIYKKGKFLPAFNRKAEDINEQNILLIENEWGKIVLKQIAGIIARRILCWKKNNDNVEIGEKIGMIMFGSQTELKLPNNVKLFVKTKDKVKAGISIIGEWDEKS